MPAGGRVFNKLSSVTSMPFTVADYLKEHGPSRSSLIADAYQEHGLSPEAARQRVSRARFPVRSFPVPMLPKREKFLYLEEQRNSERFWGNFMRDLRATGSIYGAAIDGISARGGMVTKEAFRVVSGAPHLPIRGQLSVDVVAKTLISASFMSEADTDDLGLCYHIPPSLHSHGAGNLRARAIAEGVLLDGVREWARHLGMAGYNTIRIRGEADLQPIGPFMFDLAGPSYLLPLQGPGKKPGFLVADAFIEGTLHEDDIQYFLRKSQMLKAILPGGGVLSLLVAEGFTGTALTAGHAGGIMMATPKDLFGKKVAIAMANLFETLKQAAAIASSHPERITGLLDSLVDIEGRNGNLRGIMFELMSAYLARRDAVSIEMGKTARDPKTFKTADIDILKVKAMSSAVAAIECKGKNPGGSLSKDEVEAWLRKHPTIRAYFRNHQSFQESKVSLEIWTSGTIDPDALELLVATKAYHVNVDIAWKDGKGVLDLAKEGKEKAIVDALYQHFISHPLAEVTTVKPNKAFLTGPSNTKGH